MDDHQIGALIYLGVLYTAFATQYLLIRVAIVKNILVSTRWKIITVLVAMINSFVWALIIRQFYLK